MTRRHLVDWLAPSALSRKLMRDLWHLRGQVASIAAVVGCGVMMVVSMYGTLRSVERSRDAFYTRNRFGDVFASATRAPAHIVERLGRIPGVGAIETRTELFVSMDVPGLALPAGARVISLPDDVEGALNRVHLTAGRLPRSERVDEVVISAGFARANAVQLGDSVGVVLEGRWRRVRVVGFGMSPEYVWELAAAPSFTTDERAFGILWMPRTAVEGAAGTRGAFNSLTLRLSPTANEQAVVAGIDTLLSPYGGRGAVGRARQLSNAIIEAEFRSLRVFGITIPAIFLAVAAFLVNVVLGRLVATQRSEIAALKAFGYSDHAVGVHYLGFATAAVLIGSVLGVVAGVWLGGAYTGLYQRVLRFPMLAFRPDLAATLVAIAASAAAATLGALAAVRASVRLPPAEALRPESPERYRPLLLERLGADAWLTPGARMVLRHIERRPARAASTIVGVALALALLAGTMALFDAAFYMADLQFRLAQREDIAVTFSRALDPVSGAELRRLPGVLDVESFRFVPVRIRAGSIVRTTAITGLEGDGALHRIVDRHGAIYPLPPTGVVMTASFAKLVGVARGDTLHVELLERGGASRPLRVVGLVDELFGSNLYMDQRALAALVRDAGRTNGAWLRLDPVARDGLLARLKRIPAISGATSREALIAAWDRQMLESIRVSGTLVVVCAIIIALGAVYNGARIALAERGRELASLRVLGFTRREVAMLLYGEQGVLALAALPLGIVLGIALTTFIAHGFESEDQRFPVRASAAVYGGAIAVVFLAAAIAALLIRRRLDRMDLIAVLKTRE